MFSNFKQKFMTFKSLLKVKTNYVKNSFFFLIIIKLLIKLKKKKLKHIFKVRKLNKIILYEISF